MKLLHILNGPFAVPRLNRRRVVAGLAVAVMADGLQWLLSVLGPVGFFLDEVIDIVAMVLATWAVGFHLFLLPTFLLEFVPVVGLLPTWTGCVLAVIALRKHEQSTANAAAPPKVEPSPPPNQSCIDI